MRCCLMACLLSVLSDMLQNPQPLSHIHICPKPKVKLGPTKTFYPAPPSSSDIATAINPNQFSLTDGIPSHRDGLANSLDLVALNLVLPNFVIGPTEFAWPTLWLAYYQNRSHRVCVISLTEMGLQTLCFPAWHFGLTEMNRLVTLSLQCKLLVSLS